MATAYSYGIVAERRLIEELRKQGFETIRASASKGSYDVVATRNDKVVFASVKRVATWKRAGTVYRAERRKLEALELPSTPKIERWLCVWSDELNPETPGRGGRWFCQEVVANSTSTAPRAISSTKSRTSAPNSPA